MSKRNFLKYEDIIPTLNKFKNIIEQKINKIKELEGQIKELEIENEDLRKLIRIKDKELNKNSKYDLIDLSDED